MRVLGIAIASALLITPVMIAPVMADDGINGVVRNLDRALNPDERRQQAYYYDRGNDRRYDRDRRFEYCRLGDHHRGTLFGHRWVVPALRRV